MKLAFPDPFLFSVLLFFTLKNGIIERFIYSHGFHFCIIGSAVHAFGSSDQIKFVVQGGYLFSPSA